MKEAKRFVDWSLSPKVQMMAAEAKALQLPSNKNTPIAKGSPRFSEFKIFLAYDPKKFASGDDINLGGRACCLLQLVSGTQEQAREESWRKRPVEFPPFTAEEERSARRS